MAFKKSKKLYDEDSLYEYAVGALARRMRTVAELKRLMRERQISGDKDTIIEGVVRRLKDHGYLNDTHFATLYSTLRKEGNKFGRQRVTTDLRAKGVHPDVVEKTVGAAYADVDEESLAREYMKRKRLTQPSIPQRGDMASYKQSQRETARIFRTLVRAGFKTGTIVKILKRWNVEDEVLTALEEEEDSGTKD
jgi:regulatory protein